MIPRVVGLGGLEMRLITILLVIDTMTLCVAGVGTVVGSLMSNVFVSSTPSGKSIVIVTRLRDRDGLWHRDEDRLRQSDWMRHGDWMRYRDWLRDHQRHLNQID